MTNKKYLLLIVGLLVVGVGIFMSVKKSDPEATVRSAMIIASDRPLDFSLIPLENGWNRLCIFGPYTSKTAAVDVLGFDWDITKYSHVTYHDTVATLVFVNHNEVVYSFDIEKELGDFYPAYNKCFKRSEAVFIKKNGHYELQNK